MAKYFLWATFYFSILFALTSCKNDVFTTKYYLQARILPNKQHFGYYEVTEQQAQQSIAWRFSYKNNQVSSVEYLYRGKPSSEAQSNVSKTRYDWIEKQFDPLQLAITYYNRADSQIYNDKKIWKAVILFDNNGLPSECKFFDHDNQPTVGYEGYSTIRYTANEQKQVIQALFLDTDNKPTFNDEEVYGYIYAYDSAGNCSERRCINEHAQPDNDIFAIHLYKDTFDQNHNLVVSEYFNTANLPVEGLESGIHRYEYTFDKFGYIVEQRTFNRLQQRTYDSNGACMIQWQYDSIFNTISEAYFDSTYAPVAGTMGVAMFKFGYNAEGKTIEQRHLDTKGQPVYDINGVSVVRIEYDNIGNMTQVAFYSPDDKLKNNHTGIALTKYWYNADGLIQEALNFDEKSNPVQQNDSTVISQ